MTQPTRKRWFSFSLRTLLVVVTLLCLSFACLAVYFQPATDPSEPAFDRTQWVTIQIVTAPTRSVIGGIEYDEADVVVRSSHRVPIMASGQGQSLRSTADGIPIDLHYSVARPDTEGKAIVLEDLRLFLPIKFRTTPHSSLFSLGYTGTDTTVPPDFHDFKRASGLTIHYQGEDQQNTFIRMRLDLGLKPEAVIDLTDNRDAN